MAKARLRQNGRALDVTANGRVRPITPKIDWARVDATTERQIARQIAADDAETLRDAAAYARKVRARTKLSQAKFAKGIGVPVDTVRNWEQGKRVPRGPARALLRIIGNAPEIAFGPLSDALSAYAESGFIPDEMMLDRRVENAKDEIDSVKYQRRARK